MLGPLAAVAADLSAAASGSGALGTAGSPAAPLTLAARAEGLGRVEGEAGLYIPGAAAGPRPAPARGADGVALPAARLRQLGVLP